MIANKEICLILNKNWQAIEKKTVKDAMIALASGSHLAVDIEYGFDDNGKIDYSYAVSIRTMNLDEWLASPLKEYHLYICTAKTKIRVPTVLVAHNFAKMPMKVPSLNRETVGNRDGWVCAYTGKKLTKNNATVDHILPKHRGGKNTWDNVVISDKEVNNRKGHKTNEEAGLTLLYKPKTIVPAPAWTRIRDAAHHDWNHFLVK